MAQHKKDGSCQRLVVTGCLAERYRDELRAEIPEIPRWRRAYGRSARDCRGHRRRGMRKSSPAHPSSRPTVSFRRRPQQKMCPRRHLRRCPRGTWRIVHPIPEECPRHSAEFPRHPLNKCPRHFGQRAPTRIPTDANTPRMLRHTATLRIREGGGRAATTQCALLHHPEAARRATAAARPNRLSRKPARSPHAGVKELLLISQGHHPSGIDRGERGALARLLRQLNEVERPRVDPLALPVSHDRSTTRRWRPWRTARKSAITSTCHLPARLEPGSQAHEAPGHAPEG